MTLLSAGLKVTVCPLTEYSFVGIVEGVFIPSSFTILVIILLDRSVLNTVVDVCDATDLFSVDALAELKVITVPFTDSDLEYEVSNRKKDLAQLKGFQYNDFNVWKSHFRDFSFLKAVKSDCGKLDYEEFKPIKLTFLDVDLYLPTLKALNKIYNCTCEGGVILVDDCINNIIYDGAFQAYMEFCAEKGIEPCIIGNKCGIIYK